MFGGLVRARGFLFLKRILFVTEHKYPPFLKKNRREIKSKKLL